VQQLTIATIIFVPFFVGIALMSLGSHLGLFIVQAQPVNATGLLANLTDQNHQWKPFSTTNVSQTNGNLTISIISENPKKVFNRAFLQTQVNSSTIAPPILTLDYASNNVIYSSPSKPSFVIEIRGDNGSKILWTTFLNDTSGKLLNDSFILPSNVLNKPIEFRLYIITEGGLAHSILSLNNLSMLQEKRENIPQILHDKRFLAYNLNIGNKTYTIGYDIRGGKIIGINADHNQKKMLLNVNSSTNGIVIIKVPRTLIDAKNASNVDIPHSILVDGQKAVANEIQSSNLLRILAIEFKQGNKQIEIIGNTIAPK
jgi:hypothetical protein